MQREQRRLFRKQARVLMRERCLPVPLSLTYKRVYVESYKSDTDSTITGLEADAQGHLLQAYIRFER